jgi:hypothetical protein
MSEFDQTSTLACSLGSAWTRALNGDESARREWINEDRGRWSWQGDGPRIKRGDGEWYSLRWNLCDPAALAQLGRFVVAVTVQGNAQAAGLSFGPFRDFLAPAVAQPTRLQLEVDAIAGSWRFRIDGRLAEPAWWNSAVTRVADICGHTLTLKVRHPEDVVFRDLAFHTFGESCRVSVIITCNRFVQRLRHALRSWCHQSCPSGLHEVIVVNPASADGTHEHLRSVARSYPDVRIAELTVAAKLSTNKGAMINSAIPFSRGEWIWLTDADCVFPAHAVALALDYAANHRNRLLFGQRRYLTPSRTDEILAGRVDTLATFDSLSEGDSGGRPHENAPWGYTQIVHRSFFDRSRYPESFTHYAHGDSHFIEICKSRGLLPEQVPGMFCLHLDHPFAWFGNSEFL